MYLPHTAPAVPVTMTDADPTLNDDGTKKNFFQLYWKQIGVAVLLALAYYYFVYNKQRSVQAGVYTGSV